jgi:hypothetical protein
LWTDGAAIIVCGRRVLYGGCLLVLFLNCLFVLFLNCLYRKPEQTAFINFMQCKMVIIGVSTFILLEKVTIICLVVLQICLDFVEGTTGSCSETCVTGDVDGTEEVSIKVEESIDIKDEMPEAVKC